MKRAVLAALAVISVAAVLIGPQSALAWEPIHASNPVWCETVPYSLGAVSPDLGDTVSEDVVRNALDDWTKVECTSLTAEYGGRTTATAGEYDGVSMIGWVERGWSYDSNAIGVTGPRWGGCIVEADMELNGVDYTWTTDSGRGDEVNAYSIVLHEGGHYYGLGHSSDPDASMYFAYPGGIRRMQADDEEGICALYPGASGADCTTTGCPGGQECVAGRCMRPHGDGSVCSPCERASDCGGDEDFCLAYPDGSGRCGKACTTRSDCGSNEQCVDVGDERGQCVRYNGSNPSCETPDEPEPECRNDSMCDDDERCNADGECEPRPVDRKDLGEPCTSNDECNSTLCFRGSAGRVCSQSCDWLDPSSCPDGFYCNGKATGSCGSGVCLAGRRGRAMLGAACVGNLDCQSMYCELGACAVPCVPGGATGCPDGYTCQVGSFGDACGACSVAGAVGEPCMSNDDCASSLCAVSGDNAFCTDDCDTDAACPDDYVCVSAGERKVCAPGERDGGPMDPPEDPDDCDCGVAGAKTTDASRIWIIVIAAMLAGMRWRRRKQS